MALDALVEMLERDWNGIRLAALNTKQQKDVVLFYGKITMGFMTLLPLLIHE